MMKQQPRSAEMDIIRGIGIILVVLLHVGIPSSFFCNYFNLFHMAIFFFSAGWCFSDKLLREKHGSIKFVARKLKSLYLPYVLFNGAMILLNNFFIKINIYTDKPEFLEENIGIGNAFGLKNYIPADELMRQIFGVVLGGKYGESQLGGATWFLRTLFIVTVVFFFFQKLCCIAYDRFHVKINEFVVQSILAALLLCIGWYASKNGIVNWYQVFTCASIYFIYVIGWMVRKLDVVAKLKEHIAVTILVAVVSGGLLVVVGKYATIAMNSNSYTNPFWLVCGSVFGSMLCTAIAILFGKAPAFIWRVIAYIGKNSLSIMMFQFLAFKIITLIQVCYYDRTAYLLAAFPILDTSGMWRWLYVITGVCAPLLLHAIYKGGIAAITKQYDKHFGNKA